MSLGVKYSPEGLCIPFKLTLGNMIEAAEMGADTMVLPAGYGICRLGYYLKVQEAIIRDLGYNVEIVPVGVSEQKFIGLMRIIKRLANNAPWSKILPAFRFGLKKLDDIDLIEQTVQKKRAVEQVRGSANHIYTQALKEYDNVTDYAGLKRITDKHMEALAAVPNRPGYVPLKVGITGEFYVLLEPFSNMDIENELGKMGVEVHRKTFISGWTRFSFFLNPLGLNENSRIHKAAAPYLKRDIGGDGWESVGEKVLHAGEWDGIIHLSPFTCMPEIIAENIMPVTQEKMPVLTVLCDEQLGKQGTLTRLEAFVDLLARKRRAKQLATG